MLLFFFINLVKYKKKLIKKMVKRETEGGSTVRWFLPFLLQKNKFLPAQLNTRCSIPISHASSSAAAAEEGDSIDHDDTRILPLVHIRRPLSRLPRPLRRRRGIPRDGAAAHGAVRRLHHGAVLPPRRLGRRPRRHLLPQG
jgi:hypothetical protein